MKLWNYAALAAILAAVAGPAICADKKKTKPLSAAEVYKRALPAIAAIDCLGPKQVKIGTASGFVISRDGKIVTNLHVIQACQSVNVRLAQGTAYDAASVIDYDERKDLAVIKIQAENLPPLAVGDSNELEVGQVVYSIGNASGLQNTLQQGLVSALRDVAGIRIVQVSTSINLGNSGGPILDDQARVVAVAALKIAMAENLGFAIPVNYAKGLLDGKTETPFAQFAAQMLAKRVTATAPRQFTPPQGIPGGFMGAIATGVPALPSFARIETFAGRIWRFEGDGLPAMQVALGHLHGVAYDRAGNIYAADIANQAIVKIDAKGTLHILAGPDSPPPNRPVNPQQIAVDSSGAVYFAEDGQRVRKILLSGEVVTLAGSDKRGFTPDGSPAAGSAISGINGVAVALDGTVLFSEWQNNRVRRIDSQGNLQTIAGDGQARFGGDGGPAQQASLQHPMGLATDAAGNIFIADEFNGRIRKVDAGGTISTVAGGGVTKDGLCRPMAVAVNGKGDLFIPDPCRRKVFAVRGGESSVLGGTGGAQREPQGMGGPATAASFEEWAVAVNAQDDVIVSGPDSGYVYRIGHDGVFSIVAGSGNWRVPVDGVAAANAVFQHPNRLAFDKNGSLVMTDWDANRIYRVDKNGAVTRLAGFTRPFYGGENVAATDSGVAQPTGVKVRANGAIVFAEVGGSNRIREIAPDGKIRTLAGNGKTEYSGDGGRAVNAGLSAPVGICLDFMGAVYIADRDNNRIRKVTPDGTIQLVAGNGTRGYSGDGGPAERASLNAPAGVEIGPDGSLYIADAGNRRVRKVSLTGFITSFAGDGNNRFAGDGGPAAAASLSQPYDLAIGPDRALYVLDIDAARIRRIDLASEIITTVAGNGNRNFFGDGGFPLQAGLGRSDGMAIDPQGNLYVSQADGRVRVIRAAANGAATPRLSMEPTIMMPNYGDPLGRAGSGGGIGSGSGGGVGRGTGNGGAGGTVYRIGGGVTAPVILTKREPEYTESARNAKLEGTVILSIEVLPDGSVTNIKVLHALGMGLDEKAIEAVRLWKFKPGYKDGQPVTVSAQLQVNFRLL